MKNINPSPFDFPMLRGPMEIIHLQGPIDVGNLRRRLAETKRREDAIERH